MLIMNYSNTIRSLRSLDEESMTGSGHVVALKRNLDGLRLTLLEVTFVSKQFTEKWYDLNHICHGWEKGSCANSWSETLTGRRLDEVRFWRGGLDLVTDRRVGRVPHSELRLFGATILDQEWINVRENRIESLDDMFAFWRDNMKSVLLKDERLIGIQWSMHFGHQKLT